MMSTEEFSIRTDVYEGPLELLLELIEKRKLLINDISLASVTDEYMAYVGTLEEQRLPQTAHFVVIAATLLLIKSRSLLPVLSLTEEEEASIDDLEQRLKLYRIYAHASVELRRAFGTRMLYARPFRADTTPRFRPDAYTQADRLYQAMSDVLADLPKPKQPKQEVSVKKIVSLEDMMRRLEQRILGQMKVSFRSFSGGTHERAEVIVSFLAVLELVKQGIAMVSQQERYADFDITRENIDTPSYS